MCSYTSKDNWPGIHRQAPYHTPEWKAATSAAVSLGALRAGFVGPEARWVIEGDGGDRGEWEWANYKKDRRRAEWLAARGFRVLRFRNHAVLNPLEEVKAVVWGALSLDAQPPSRPSPCQGEGAMRGYVKEKS
ncbi:MAG: DUF559 domain-containing protein [Gammaproteobacteria bacterium]